MIEKQLAFLENHPKGIYRTEFLSTLAGESGEELDSEDRARFEENLSWLYSNSKEGYIQTPQEFFQRWMNGRLDKTPNLDSLCKGFELQLPQVKFQKQLEDDTRHYGRIEGLVIASDFGYSGDFHEDMVFAINDIPSKRVLVYRDEDTKKFKAAPLAKKNLIPQRIYPFGKGQEEFPFESLNPLKSMEYTWSLVNIQPEEVYKALKEIGFNC